MQTDPGSPGARLAVEIRRLRLHTDWLGSAALAITGVGLATLVLLPFTHLLGEGDTALLYMPLIVGIAALGGARAGLVAAVVGFFVAKYFFIPTYYSLHVQDARDWVSLFVFVTIGLAMGVQSTRMQRRQAELEARERELGLLYHLAEVLTSQRDVKGVCDAVARQVAELSADTWVAVFVRGDDGRTSLTSEAGTDEGARVAASRIASSMPDEPAEIEGLYALPLGSSGLLVVRLSPLGTRERLLLASLTHLASTHLVRLSLQRVAAQAEALREGDRLKSTLVSSVSHELKTPLAGVTAIVTHLLESDLDRDAATMRAELLPAADGLRRLNNSIGDLLDLSRLESGAWMPHRECCEVEDIVETVRSRLLGADQHRLHVEVAPDLPLIEVDEVQWGRMLTHLVENALQYSPAEAPVVVRAHVRDGRVVLEVEDQGPGVEAGERARIFEKFYRGSAASRAPGGTGLGLAISADIVAFHQATLTVERADPRGARFVVTLPTGAASERTP